MVISPEMLKAIEATDPEYFSEGLCRFSYFDISDGSSGFGYMDKTGKMVLPPIYREYSSRDDAAFHDGLALVRDERYTAGKSTIRYIDKNGDAVVDNDVVVAGFGTCTRFEDGKAACCSYEFIDGKKYYIFSIIDRSGRVLATYRPRKSDGSHAFLSPKCYFSEGYFVTFSRQGFDLHVFDVNGNMVWRLETPDPYEFRYSIGGKGVFSGVHGGILVYSSGKYSEAVEIPSGRSILPEGKRYEYIYDDFSDDVSTFRLEERGSYGVIDSNGFEVVEPGEFNGISPFNEGLAIAMRRNDGKEVYYLLEKHEGTWVGDPPEQPTSPTTPAGPNEPGSQPSDWAKAEVNRAIEQGILPAELQNSYGQPVTRAEFCQLADGLYTAVKGSPAQADASVTFTDTDEASILRMASVKVVYGMGDGQFNPEANLTREQAASMLVRLSAALDHLLSAGGPTFTDNAAISAWALADVGQIQASGNMSGMGDDTFAPQGTYTREQAVATMMRLYDLLQD